MHQYVTGHWAASDYNVRGERMDHRLFLSPDGSFVWTRRDEKSGEQSSAGSWTHDAAQDVLTFSHASGQDEGRDVSWSIRYVTGCEDSNMILALRWVALASPNLPLVFRRFHPPDDPVWHAR